jgi:hypothetical protein
MVNQRVVASALGIWALSCVPTASATSWDVCITNAAGVQTCHNTLPVSAKINIAIACVVVVLVLLCLVICVINNRRARAAAEREYNVEANQVDGPPTIIATEYNPTSGPSGIYEGPKSGFSAGQSSAQMTGPTYPVAAQVYSQTRTVTAPVTQSVFPNPPPGYSSHMGPPPQTSFVSGGFPRAMLAGDRLKDRLKERPASLSHSLG